VSRTVTKDSRVKYCCGHSSQVVNSRDSGIPSANSRGVYRRRFCQWCGESWTTAEISMDDLLKNAGNVTAEDAVALRGPLSLIKAAADQIDEILKTVEGIS